MLLKIQSLLVNEIFHWSENLQVFRIYIVLPLLPGFDSVNAVRAVLYFIMRSIAKGDFRYESTKNEPVEQIKHLARLMGIESNHAEYIAREINSLRPGQAMGPDQVYVQIKIILILKS